MSAYFNLGSEITSMEAVFATLQGDPTIVVRCCTGNYPLMGLHLSPGMAERLITSLREALASMPQMENHA